MRRYPNVKKILERSIPAPAAVMFNVVSNLASGFVTHNNGTHSLDDYCRGSLIGNGNECSPDIGDNVQGEVACNECYPFHVADKPCTDNYDTSLGSCDRSKEQSTAPVGGPVPGGGVWSHLFPDEKQQQPICAAFKGPPGDAAVCKPAVPGRKETRSMKRSWLIDTGCPFDLAAAGDLQEDDFIVENDDGIVLETTSLLKTTTESCLLRRTARSK